MGVPLSKNPQELKNFEKSYMFVREISDSNLGIVEIWKEKNTINEILLIKKSLSSDQEFMQLNQSISDQIKFDHPCLMKILNWFTSKSEGICGFSRIFYLQVEYNSHNLSKELKRRIKNEDFFAENELLYIAKSCIELGFYLQQRGIYHGDYRPSQIFFQDSETSEGYLKMYDLGLISLYRDNFHLTISGVECGYLTPSLLEHIREGDYNPDYDVYKADVFSLGVTLLECATLLNPTENFYAQKQHYYLSNNVKKGLNYVFNNYSNFFYELLFTMLDEIDDKRPDFIYLKEAFFPDQITPVILPNIQYIQPSIQYVQPVVQNIPNFVSIQNSYVPQNNLNFSSNYQIQEPYFAERKNEQKDHNLNDLEKRIDDVIKKTELAMEKNKI